MNNTIKIFMFCVVFITYSCSTSKFYGDEELGAGYFLQKDGRYKSIDFSPDNNYRGDGGYAVIKENVKSLNYDNSHIIVQTSRYESPSNEVIEYWIIDKNIPIKLNDFENQKEFNKLLKSGLTGPLDSVEFYQQLKEKDISLKLREK